MTDASDTQKTKLDAVYAGDGGAATQALYDDWAARYDRENREKGFRLPELGAGWLRQFQADADGEILDAGCGTGLVGEALKFLGAGRLTGLDLSEGMLARARSLGIYGALIAHRLGEALPFDDHRFAAAGCYGSFGPGHAPPESLNELRRVTAVGGVVAFNILEASYVDQGFPAVMDRLTHDGRWREIARSPAFPVYSLAEPELLVRFFAFRVLN